MNEKMTEVLSYDAIKQKMSYFISNEECLEQDARISENFKTSESEIRTFLKDKSIFITGATGFLGKVLLEKILRSCPEVKSLLVLIREKKGKSLNDRLDELFENSVFLVLKKIDPNFRTKVHPINGDIEKIGMGISEEDRLKIQAEVSVIFHLAATVRFNEKLKTAILMNVRGTAEALRLASGCKQLVAFVQYSTAYSFCHRNYIDEKFYSVCVSPTEMIDIAENADEEQLREMEPGLIANYPNTYTFSKALSEEYIRTNSCGLPVCIVRPSIVIGAYREPIRSWTDNIYGPAGAITAGGLGLLRTVPVDKDKVADLVPVDMVTNNAIAAAWQTAKLAPLTKEPKIYNYVSSPQKPITWGNFFEDVKKYGIHLPSLQAVWYYCLFLTKNWYIFALQTTFLHFLPALVADAICFVIRKERRFWKTYKKLHKFIMSLSYFTLHEWTFTNKNTQELWSTLNEADKQIFYFDIGSIDWERILETCILGLRLYIVKDPLSTLPQAKIRWQRLKILHYGVGYSLLLLEIFIGLKLLSLI